MDTILGSTALIQKNMPLTRRRILMLLKEKGELTADELAEALGISAVAVRRHLTKLESDDLVTYREVQRGMGRPSYVYRLGEAAASFFPRRYEELAINVLETIRELYGKEAIDAIFRMRTDHLIQSYRSRISGQTLDARLEQLTRLREAEGYMPSWEADPDGTFILREANCPIFYVAAGCESACDHDLTLLTEVLDAEVIRTRHLARGDEACCYQIRPRTASTSPTGD
ncbi:MAG: transcriptional regulator [Chloroflexi bacterium]|nr:MAG: transcriptional regulator [Chloroflexota bacterium]